MGWQGYSLEDRILTSLVNLRTKKLGCKIAQLNIEQLAQYQYFAERMVND